MRSSIIEGDTEVEDTIKAKKKKKIGTFWKKEYRLVKKETLLLLNSLQYIWKIEENPRIKLLKVSSEKFLHIRILENDYSLISSYGPRELIWTILIFP